MKKVTIIAAAFVLFTGTLFAAGPDSVSPEAKAAFSKEFGKAENVSWKLNGGMYFVQFTLNEKKVTASYNSKGELTGTSRMLSKSELPLIVSRELAKQYAEYELSPSFNEITFDGETSYYFTASNKKFDLNVKSDNEGNFTIESRTKK